MKLKFKVFLSLGAILCVLGTFTFISFVPQSYAKNDVFKKPYKATTVDECIQEKMCVWHHFSNQVFPTPRDKHGIPAARLIKWAGNLNVMFTGNNAYGKYVNSFIKIALQLGPFVDLSMEITNPSNALIIISNDWKSELNKIMPKLDNLSAGTQVQEFYDKNVARSNGCMSLYLGDLQGEAIISSLIFINPDLTETEPCLATQFYATFGLHNNSVNLGLSLLKSHNGNDIKYSLLAQLIIFFLYQPEFSSDLDVSETQIIFDKTYERNKELFLKKYEEVKGIFENE